MAYGKFSAYDILGYDFPEKASYVICTVPGINHSIWKLTRYPNDLPNLYKTLEKIREDRDVESMLLITKQVFLDNPDLNTIRLLPDERACAMYFKPKLRPTDLTERQVIKLHNLQKHREKDTKHSYAGWNTIGCVFTVNKQAHSRELKHEEFAHYYTKKSIVLDQLAIDKAIRLDDTVRTYRNNFKHKNSDYIKDMFKMTLHSATGPVKYIHPDGYMIIRKEGSFWLVHDEAKYKRLRKKTVVEKKVKIKKDEAGKLEKPDITPDLLYNIMYALRNAVAGIVGRGGYNLSDGQSKGRWNAIAEIVNFYPVVEYLFKSKAMVQKTKGSWYGKTAHEKLKSMLRELKTYNLEYTWRMIIKPKDKEEIVKQAKSLSKQLVKVLHWKKKDFLIPHNKLKAKAAKILLKSLPRKKSS